MQGQIESPDVRRAVEENHCSVACCKEIAAADLENRAFCVEHFLSVSLGELESRSGRLMTQPFDAAATDSFKKFLQVCEQHAQRLSESEHLADPEIGIRLREILRRASKLSRGLRRSQRVAASVPVWLRREDPGRTWEEETWTSTVSRYGAGMVCRHPVEVGGTVVLCRRDRGSRVSARVVYSRYDSDGRRQIGVELLDHDDFWELSKISRVTRHTTSPGASH